jgi:hypothetical protein
MISRGLTSPKPISAVIRAWYIEYLTAKDRELLCQTYQLMVLADLQNFNKMMNYLADDQLKKLLYLQREEKHFKLVNDAEFLLIHAMVEHLQIPYQLNFSLQAYTSYHEVGLELAFKLRENLALKSDTDQDSHLNAMLRNSNLDFIRGFAGPLKLVLVVLFSPFIAVLYSLDKIRLSLSNIFHGRKLGKGLLRILGTALGGTTGVFNGIPIGAALGSVIPGVGTLAGSIIGGIYVGGLGTGAGTALGKYFGQIMSVALVKLGYYKNENIIRPSNPEKYRLSQTQLQNFTYAGVADTPKIYQMLRAVQNQKSKLGFGLDPEQKVLKNNYNKLITAIKEHPSIIEKTFYKTDSLWFQWDGYMWHEGNELNKQFTLAERRPSLARVTRG